MTLIVAVRIAWIFIKDNNSLYSWHILASYPQLALPRSASPAQCLPYQRVDAQQHHSPSTIKQRALGAVMMVLNRIKLVNMSHLRVRCSGEGGLKKKMPERVIFNILVASFSSCELLQCWADTSLIWTEGKRDVLWSRRTPCHCANVIQFQNSQRKWEKRLFATLAALRHDTHGALHFEQKREELQKPVMIHWHKRRRDTYHQLQQQQEILDARFEC